MRDLEPREKEVRGLGGVIEGERVVGNEIVGRA